MPTPDPRTAAFADALGIDQLRTRAETAEQELAAARDNTAQLRSDLTTAHRALHDIANLAAAAEPIDNPTTTIDTLGEIVRLARAATRTRPG